MFEKLWTKWLKMSASDDTHYSFMQLLASEGLVPHYSGKAVKQPLLKRFGHYLASSYVARTAANDDRIIQDDKEPRAA